jgi:hypothetical protein
MEFFIIGAWQIWEQRNNFIFDRGHPYFDSWRQHFSEHWMEDWKRKVESGKMASASELGLDNISFPF